MISEGTILYYCVGTMVPGFNATDNSVTVTYPDPMDIDDNVTSSSDCVESEYSDSYTLTLECGIMDGVALQILNEEAFIANHTKQVNSHFKWLANYHTSICKLKIGFRHRNYWNRIRSRCWVSSIYVNPIVVLIIAFVII